jgi:hypothetical protein
LQIRTKAAVELGKTDASLIEPCRRGFASESEPNFCWLCAAAFPSLPCVPLCVPRSDEGWQRKKIESVDRL